MEMDFFFLSLASGLPVIWRTFATQDLLSVARLLSVSSGKEKKTTLNLNYICIRINVKECFVLLVECKVNLSFSFNKH